MAVNVLPSLRDSLIFCIPGAYALGCLKGLGHDSFLRF